MQAYIDSSHQAFHQPVLISNLFLIAEHFSISHTVCTDFWDCLYAGVEPCTLPCMLFMWVHMEGKDSLAGSLSIPSNNVMIL